MRKQSKPKTEEMGICTSAFGHRTALSAAKLRLLDRCGLEWFEISGLEDQHLCVFDTQRVRELVAAMEGMKLQPWSFHAPFCGLAMDDSATRSEGERRLLQTLRVARRFGVRTVVVHPGRDVPCRNRKRELRWLRDGMARVADAMPSGMQLAIETMGHKALCGPSDEMVSFVDGLRGFPAGICFDTGHVNLDDDVLGYIRAVAGRIITVHLHDNHGDRDAHAMPGEGTITWPAVLKALRQAGYGGPWMAETGPKEGSVPRFVADYRRRMRNYLAQR